MDPAEIDSLGVQLRVDLGEPLLDGVAQCFAPRHLKFQGFVLMCEGLGEADGRLAVHNDVPDRRDEQEHGRHGDGGDERAGDARDEDGCVFRT